MKSYALIGLACVAGVSAKKTEAQEVAELAQQEKLSHQLNGFKGFYDGYYRSFYKVNSHEEVKNLDDCMNDATIENIVAVSQFVNNPLAMFEMKNIKEDMNLFGEGAEIMEDLSACHFEQSFFDVWGMCQDNKEICAMSQITENLTKNMFVLMGKMTAMAETMKEFKPTEDGEELNEEEYYENMREIGTDAGTFFRVIYNYQTPEQMK
jgi:hypothetical protein